MPLKSSQLSGNAAVVNAIDCHDYSIYIMFSILQLLFHFFFPCLSLFICHTVAQNLLKVFCSYKSTRKWSSDVTFEPISLKTTFHSFFV